MARREAVERRRVNHKLARQHRREEQARAQRVLELSYSFEGKLPAWIPPDQIQPIHRDRRFWQALQCGWDCFSEMLRAQPGTAELAPPDASEFWLWWKSLHHESRAVLVALSAKLAAPIAAAEAESDAKEKPLPKAVVPAMVEVLLNTFPDDQALGWGRTGYGNDSGYQPSYAA